MDDRLSLSKVRKTINWKAVGVHFTKRKPKRKIRTDE